MSVRSGRDRVGELQLRLPPPKRFASASEMNDQVTASSSPRAASTRRAMRRRFWMRRQHARRDVVEARQRIDRHLVDAHHAHDLFDEVGLLRHVRAATTAP